MKKLYYAVIMMVLSLLLFTTISEAQEPGKTELKQIIRKFKNYRFGSVALYQITNITEIRKAIDQKEMASAGGPAISDDAIKGINDELKNAVGNQVRAGNSLEAIAQDLMTNRIPFEQSELTTLFNYYVAKESGASKEKIENIFVITTKPKIGEIPKTIIGMVTSTELSEKLEPSLKNVGPSNIYVYDELKEFKLDSSFSAESMYDLLVNSFIQQNFKNRTIEMQGIGKPGFFAKRIFGISKSLSSNESDMTTWDIQTFMKISQGQPQKMGLLQNEVIISPDLLSWKHYNLQTYEENGVFVVDSFQNTNLELPQLGVELRYGIDEINYFSFWSERLTAYALWKSVKLGVILPTGGWSNLSKDLFEQERNLTHGGVGIAGEFDFPIKVIPKSGLFHLAFGYVFGDAAESEYRKRILDPKTYVYQSGGLDDDYLVRFNFNFHYTFGMAIDEDYKVRFGVGFTGYGLESWKYESIAQGDEMVINHTNFENETIFGLSGKMEFMVTNVATPYGASLQYFDQSIGGGIWLQIPLYKNVFALRLDARGFAPISRENNDWETGGYFTPMGRFIVNF